MQIRSTQEYIHRVYEAMNNGLTSRDDIVRFVFQDVDWENSGHRGLTLLRKSRDAIEELLPKTAKKRENRLPGQTSFDFEQRNA